MTNTDTRNVAATVKQINALERAGCEIARVAIPDADAVRALADIKKGIAIPLIADIHFQAQLAIDAININAMLQVVLLGIRAGTDAYFEAALVMALLGFVSSAALAKFLMRGEVIE